MPIYMKYDTIKGEVTEEGHKQWIEVNSFQWGVGRGISSPTGSAKSRESSAPSVSEITVTKPQDESTVALLDELYQGKAKPVEIDFVSTDQGKLRVYLQFKLTNVLLSGYSISSGGDRPSESLSLNFTKIETKMTPYNADNAAGTPVSTVYDIALAKVG